jgi:hypothetical protein
VTRNFLLLSVAYASNIGGTGAALRGQRKPLTELAGILGINLLLKVSVKGTSWNSMVRPSGRVSHTQEDPRNYNANPWVPRGAILSPCIIHGINLLLMVRV